MGASKERNWNLLFISATIKVSNIIVGTQLGFVV